MKHLKEVENKVGESKAYRYIMGAIYFALDKVKNGFFWAIKHIVEITIAISFCSMIIVAEAFYFKIVSVEVALLFLLILIILFIALIKIKILENRK